MGHSRSIFALTAAFSLAACGTPSDEPATGSSAAGAAGRSGGAGAAGAPAGGAGGTSGGAGGAPAGSAGAVSAGSGGAPVEQPTPPCVSGEPPTLLTSASKPVSVAVSGDTAYFLTFSGELREVKLSTPGSSSKLLMDGGRDLQAWNGRLLWGTQNMPGAVHAATLPHPTAFATVALSASGSVYAIATRADGIFFAAGSTISRVTPGAAPSTVLTDADDGIVALAVDDTHAYFVAFRPVGGVVGTVIKRAPLAGGATEEIAVGAVTSQGGIALSPTHVVWTTDTTIQRRAKSGGTVETLASQQEAAIDVAVDGDAVYWVTRGWSGNMGSNGAVRKKVGNGPVTTLAAGQSNPIHLAIDETCVYWVENATQGAVRRVAR